MRRPLAKPAGVATVAAAALVAAVLAGCGVPTQDTATPLVIESFHPATPTPEASTSDGPARLWFVEEGRLVERPGRVGPPTVGDLLDQLAGGPPEGSPPTVRSLLTDPAHGGTLLAASVDQAARTPEGLVTLVATDAFGSLPADEQVLLIGQLVMSLCAAGAGSVQIVDANGVPLAVPLPDGRLLDRPATANDYAGLVVGLP